ncbi:hypothetical protein [Burkholderia sp. Ax-1724]|uniref:hypothetical protein n=1 Tax=Burkholderia sp. Ax-1724 TaxID=2608336 RepID=UPI0014219D43|nr:hypothetical protein [Burkholderia sp. Ax-1724]NIF51434.1 hypothetical protein [Burkholderia sp. Ax-1724]
MLKRTIAAAKSIARRGARQAPTLKKPRTAHDHAMIARAVAKRERKAAKRRLDAERTVSGQEFAFDRIICRVRHERLIQHQWRVADEAAAAARVWIEALSV